MTNNMTRNLKRLGAGLLLSATAMAPMAANANCVPTVTVGWKVPFTMTTLNKGAVSTYTNGYLVGGLKSTWAGTNPQLFSNRIVACPPGSFCQPQPFDVSAPDYLNVQIPLNHKVTITLLSQGNAQVTFAGKCDLTTGLFYGSASWPPNTNDTMLIVNFGTPFKPLPS